MEGIGRIVKDHGIFPLFDVIYLGFNSGSINDDAFAIRHFISLHFIGIEVAICLSFAKNTGLYGERVGAFLVVLKNETVASNVQSVLEMLQRSEVSDPPAYGAKIVATFLESDDLRHMWYQDLGL
ncbi:hypothetical protein AnigIFM62618_011695 [Aspergillus niger]|nr:hypothetical protein AnigIFM62618_011695 [Aspergillus niger]